MASARRPVWFHLIAIFSRVGERGRPVRLDQYLLLGPGIRAVGGETAVRRQRSPLGHASPENPPGLGPCGVSARYVKQGRAPPRPVVVRNVGARGEIVVLQPHPSAAHVYVVDKEELGRPVSAAFWRGCAEANGSRCLRRAIAEDDVNQEASICGAMAADLLALGH